MLATVRTLTLALAVVAALLVPPAHARDRASDEAAAQAAYRQGEWQTAKASWLAVLEEGGGASALAISPSERARVLYNLGNTAFRAGHTLEAVGWYTAALRLRPRDAETWQNLEHARSAAKLEPADRGDLSATARRLFSSLTLAESEWLVLAVVLAWAGVLAMEALRGGRLWRRLALLGVLAIAVSCIPLGFGLVRDQRGAMLAIQEGKLSVKSEPRADAAVIAEISAGDEVQRLDTLPDWTKIEISTGVDGWVESRAVFALDR
jgi:tetratricopeptide (TPR) repeat protein